MKPSILIACALITTSLSGCVQNYAEREIVQGQAQANLVVLNAPAEATITVDGRALGTVGQHAQGLSLSPGRHAITISLGQQTLHQQAVFVAAGARIEVRVP